MTSSNIVKLEIQFTIIEFLVKDAMNLSFTIIIVKEKSIRIPEVKKICNDYKL